MQRQFVDRKRVVVYLDAAELAEWQRKAGKGGLSAWIRGRCNEGASSAERQDSGWKGDSLPDLARRPSRSSDSAGICPHHKQRGELCYRCDYRFGNPVIDGKD